jgi:hypothetical protein
MEILDLFILEMRMSVLEDVLKQDEKLRLTFLDTYTRIRRQVLDTKPQNWEQLLVFLDSQILRFENS